jgi:flagellar basal body-associated protein FliL
MGKSNFIFIILLISVLILAILTLVLGMSSGIIGGEARELTFQSPVGVTQPEEGYVTPVYDPWTTVTVTVESDEDVEVFLYSSNYRGGRVFNNAGNESVIRDEFLVDGEQARRIGTNVVLSDFTSVSNQYMVDVVEPGTSIPSDVDYTISIEASTRAIAVLLYMSLMLMGLFAIMMIYWRVFGKEKKSEVKEDRPSYAGGYQQGQWSPPPPGQPQPFPPPPPAAPPPSPPTIPQHGQNGRQPQTQETPAVGWEQSTR